MEYLDENYESSVFESFLKSGNQAVFHLNGHRIVQGSLRAVERFDFILETGDGKEESTLKHNVKMVYDASLSSGIRPLLKTDNNIKAQNFKPILSGAGRNHIKNKTLFPLMKDRTVLFFCLLEGEIIKGIILGFSRYEITVGMKGGLPVTILRHAVYDLRDKRKKCFLKRIQQIKKDWKSSSYYIEANISARNQ